MESKIDSIINEKKKVRYLVSIGVGEDSEDGPNVREKIKILI